MDDGSVFHRVADTQAASDVQIAALEAETGVRLPDELHQDADGLAEGVELKDLAADVGMQADQVADAERPGPP